jgi:hypothetical protein
VVNERSDRYRTVSVFHSRGDLSSRTSHRRTCLFAVIIVRVPSRGSPHASRSPLRSKPFGWRVTLDRLKACECRRWDTGFTWGDSRAESTTNRPGIFASFAMPLERQRRQGRGLQRERERTFKLQHRPQGAWIYAGERATMNFNPFC